MKIGNVIIKCNALLAPLAGFTDVGFRDVCSRYGAGATYTEMVSCKGIFYGSEKTKEILAIADSERIKVAQIFGNNPDIMSRAVVDEVFQKFQIIDINMGCPVPKIFNNGEGSSLLKVPSLAEEIVAAVVSATDKPVTVKTRLGIGIGEKSQVIALAKAVERGGAAAVAIHGRTREQYYGGKADWRAIADVREAISLPLIANGDVKTVDDYADCMRQTGADAVMIGRGAVGNPQIFRQISLMEGTEREYDDVDTARDILQQIATLKGHYDDRYIYTSMRKQMCHYAKGIKGSRAIKDAACHVESVEELIEIVISTYSNR